MVVLNNGRVVTFKLRNKSKMGMNEGGIINGGRIV